MSNFSTLAETIADYATSIAKQYGNDQVGRFHLLAAIRRWHGEKFNTLFPDEGEAVDHVLQQERGKAFKVEGMTEQVVTFLDGISSADDVWNAATEIVTMLPPPVETLPAGPEAAADSTAKPEPAAPAPQVFAVTDSLIARVAAVVQRATNLVGCQVLSDCHAVASHILGKTEGLAELLTSAAHIDGVVAEPSTVVSTLVNEVSVQSHPDAHKAATQLALALVEVAHWAAVMDHQVTEEETNRIDEIRLQLREQLGDRINAQSPAIEEFERKFSRLVGMQSVKDELRKRVDYLVVSKRREQYGHPEAGRRMHLAFVGNPGTGKTTVARLYGELLNELGLLPNQNFVETDRSGLVGEFVGHTETKTMKAIEQADGGVLFVDEVYALNDRYGEGRKGYGEEATNVLVKQMEDRRDRLVVVVAGYKDQTMDFISMNPGLRSRIPLIVDFPDYSRDELSAICERIAGVMNLSIEPEALARLVNLLEQQRRHDGFGNARSAENALQLAHRNAVSRLADLGDLATEDELSTLVASDVPDPEPEPEEPAHRRIGFI